MTEMDSAPYGHTVGEVRGPRAARVRGGRSGPWVVVERTREDGALDWYTLHWTRWGARRAAALYERTGRTRGLRP